MEDYKKEKINKPETLATNTIRDGAAEGISGATDAEVLEPSGV